MIEDAIVNNWYKDALTDYKGATLQYHDVARKIEKLHIMFESIGLQKGDKVALCGRNSSMWACAFLATLTYGAVAVPIQHEFTPAQVYNVVNHSDARLLFVGDVVATQLDYEQMPHLEGIVYIPDFSIVLSRSEQITYAREHLNEVFGKKYPKYFRKEHVHYYNDQEEDLALINYTSGTTGFSKGVMLPYRALWSNISFIERAIGSKLPKNANALSILPMAHMYGMACEFLLQFCIGGHTGGHGRDSPMCGDIRTPHHRENHSQEDIPPHHPKPATAHAHAGHWQESAPAHLRPREARDGRQRL